MKRLPIFKSVSRMAGFVLKRAGYRWELRRSGELKLGLWRKPLGSPRGKSAPRRLVFVPGFGDSALSWMSVLSVLTPLLRRAGYDELVLLDFPGFNGFMAGEKSFHSVDLLSSAVSDVFDSLAPEALLGHSLGGWLCARYAIDCGKGARPAVRKRHGYRGPGRLILCGPPGVFPRGEARSEFEGVFRRLVGSEGFEAVRRHLFAREPFWFKYLASEFSGFASDEGIRQFIESVGDRHSFQEELAHMRAQTWLIWGDSDTLCRTEWLDLWNERLNAVPGADAHAVLIHGAGHSPQIERPAVLVAILGQILLGRKPHARGLRWWKVVGAGSAPVTA